MIKIIDTIDINPILDFFKTIESKVEWTNYGNNNLQAGLQARTAQSEWSEGVGQQEDNSLIYSYINPILTNSVIADIIQKYEMFRTRLMIQMPYSCYSMHSDDSPRIHIPIITDKDCYFIFKSIPPIHMSVGRVYLVDTRKTHSAINCSNIKRLHIVGSVKYY